MLYSIPSLKNFMVDYMCHEMFTLTCGILIIYVNILYIILGYVKWSLLYS